MAFNLVIFSVEGDVDVSLLHSLNDEGVDYIMVGQLSDLASDYDAALIDLSVSSSEGVTSLVERCKDLAIPLLCAVPEHNITRYSPSWGATDFILLPPRKGELTIRLRQVTHQPDTESSDKVLHVGDLRVDLEKYEVFNKNRRVLLTFKEYQLLCLLASSPGRVFTRESLLNQIWEYDYYGGTRTVDVHIRRLRSKIEDPGQTYIETVWNVGYRFKEQVNST